MSDNHRQQYAPPVTQEAADQPAPPATVAVVVSVLFALMNVGYMLYARTLPWDDATVSFFSAFLGLAGCLFVAAVVAFARRKNKGATTFMIVGGILNFPIGLVAIFFGVRARP